MSRPPTLDQIDRAYELFSNHTALKILDALGRGERIDAAALGDDQHAITDAVALLDRMGLVEPAPALAPSAEPKPVLTGRGKGLVDLLEEISRHPE
jgi:hypothetical protein